MGFSLDSLMGLLNVSSPGSIATQLITPKSLWTFCHYMDGRLPSNRILLANIKNLGQCPCPRCMVKLTEVRDLGKEMDRQRHANVRKPTRNVLHLVRKARKAVFKGYKVSDSRIEKLLGGGSRVPTIVSRPHGCPTPPEC